MPTLLVEQHADRVTQDLAQQPTEQVPAVARTHVLEVEAIRELPEHRLDSVA